VTRSMEWIMQVIRGLFGVWAQGGNCFGSVYRR
jgi:hypothetical protein